MSRKARIALIHATRVAMDPVEAAAKKIWPEAELVSILEEGLSMDSASSRVTTVALNTRIVDLARYAERLNPDGILYTCSAFGEGIEQAARTSKLPVHKPNEAMFDAAFNYGDNIAMVYTFPSAVAGLEREFYQFAEQKNSKAKISSVFAEGARDALKEGDVEKHNTIIAQTAIGVSAADAILLAPFSMAPAVQTVRDVVNTPILTSPESAIEKMKKCITIDKLS